jgi:hypothetical protein
VVFLAVSGLIAPSPSKKATVTPVVLGSLSRNGFAATSDGFEKVFIGTRGARETFLDVAKARAKSSVLKNASGAKLTKTNN